MAHFRLRERERAMHSTREHPAPWECVASSGGGVKEFEAALRPWLHGMARLAWQEFVQAVERRVSAENGPGLREKSWEDRVLWTCTGPVKVRRRHYYHADGRERKSFVAFDMRVGLAPREHVTPTMRCRLARLAAIAPSYEAARVSLETMLGESPSARTIWKCAQAEGERLREHDREKRRSVFEDGELPGGELPEKDFVGIEADSTMVHAWRSKGANHETFVGAP